MITERERSVGVEEDQVLYADDTICITRTVAATGGRMVLGLALPNVSTWDSAGQGRFSSRMVED